jgi:hypothetical protein
MRYQIQREPLIVGGHTIAPGVVVDLDDDSLPSQLMRDKPPPLNALALYYEALAAMHEAYGPSMHVGPGAQLFAAPGLDLKTAFEIAKPIRELRAQQAEQRKVEAAMVMLDEINRQIAAAQEELAALKRQIAELTKVRDTIVGEMKSIASRLQIRSE